MKHYLIFIFMIPIISLAQSPGQWTWMRGDSTFNTYGYYDASYIGIEDTLIDPLALTNPSGVVDKDGNFWMFGGYHFDDNLQQPVNSHFLWKFNPYHNKWTLIRGQEPISGGWYGTQGIPDSLNYPPGRFGALMWIDTSGNLWVFGGKKQFALNQAGVFNDLWKFNISTNEWTWMKGTSLFNEVGTYGTKGVPDAANTPGGRCESATWIDDYNNLWFFGGLALMAGHVYFQDIWKFDISSNNWTWMTGSNFPVSTYHKWGNLEVPDTSNVPFARSEAAYWKGKDNNFYIFGGLNTNLGTSSSPMLPDLWRFSPLDLTWAWLRGDSNLSLLSETVSGVKCVFDSLNNPKSRCGHVAWFDVMGKEWIYGGINYITGIGHDLWCYSVDSNQWANIQGDTAGFAGNYGVKGISTPFTGPPDLEGAVAWVDSLNNLWLFGGDLNDVFVHNDLWRYIPDTTCSMITSSHEPLTIADRSIYPNPASTFITIQSSDLNDCSISLFDAYGRTVFSTPLLKQSSQTITLPQLPNGIYIYQIQAEDKIKRGKLEIIR